MKSLHERLLHETKLNEMPYHKKDFMIRASHRFIQIAENWCLVRYCTIYDNDNLNRKHWKHELNTHISYIQKMIVKSNNKVDKRKSYLYDEWITGMEYNNNNTLYDLVYDKLVDEEQLSLDIVKTLVNDIITNIDDVLTICAQITITQNKSYINSI